MTREQMMDAVPSSAPFWPICPCGTDIYGIGWGACLSCGGDACEECAEMSDDERPTFRHKSCEVAK